MSGDYSDDDYKSPAGYNDYTDDRTDSEGYRVGKPDDDMHDGVQRTGGVPIGGYSFDSLFGQDTVGSVYTAAGTQVDELGLAGHTGLSQAHH